MYYYIYVLRSLKDNKFYTGYTNDLRKRIQHHKKGLVQSTKNRLPVKLIYFEGCKNHKMLQNENNYLKTTYGKRYIKNRLKNYIEEYSTG